MTYLVVRDSEDRGVYRFDSRGVAEKIAYNFKNYVFMHEDELDKALALAEVNEVTDALFLIRKFNAKAKREEKKATTKEEKKETVSCDKSMVAETTKKDSEHPFIKIYNKMREQGNTLRVTLVNGDVYVLSMKSYFIKMINKTVGNLLISSGGDISVNELAIDAAIKNHAITCLPKTRVDFVGNYMMLSNCDDQYSPNHRGTKAGEDYECYVHQYNKVAIDMNAIASVAIVDDFNFGSNEIITADIIVKYLVKKMLNN